MILDGAVFRYGHEFLRRELKDKGHDADVGASRLHGARGFRIPQRFELMDGQTFFLRGGAQGVRPCAFFFGSAEDGGDFVAASEKRFEHGFAEVLLSDNRDFHFCSLAGRRRLPLVFGSRSARRSSPAPLSGFRRCARPAWAIASTLAGDAESLIGMPMLNHLPRCGWSSSTYMSRPRTCSSLARSAVDMIGPQGTSSAFRMAISSRLV